MNDLSNFVPLTEKVTMRDTDLEVVGVDLEDLGQIAYRFPEISKMITERKFDPKALSRQAMSAFVAVGLGKAGDAEAEKSIASLSLGERMVLFNAVFRLTSPGGIGPFVEMVVAIGGGELPIESEAEPKKNGARIRFKPSSTQPTS